MKTLHWNIAIIVLVLIGIGGIVLGTTGVSAARSVWNSCTKGKVNCAYPGDCHDYIDTNKDRICDRSQSEPKTTTTAIAAATPTVKTTLPATAIIQTTAVQTSTTAPASGANIDQNDVEATTVPGVQRRTYYLVPILLISAILYGLSWILAARKKISFLLHRKIWNTALLVYALVSCLLGILLVIRIETGFDLYLPFDLLFWHVEAGIAMALISVFHVVWHRKYFARLFKKNPGANAG